jgi:predicted ATPase/DNA-binding CsgD family transcriptional regulator
MALAHNLESSGKPQPARTSLIGREAELRTLVALLQDGATRLVTVTGAGGVGKSVVANEAARRLVEQVPLSVRHVALRGRTRPVGWQALVPELVSLQDGGRSRTALAGRRRLVLLDGAEAVPGAGSAVTAALDSDPGLLLLITSVTPLRVPGEQLLRLGPLPLPQPGFRDPARAAVSPAVRLFCERVRAVDPDFELSPERTPEVVEICILLDGLPLALELAASRCTTMNVGAVLDLYRSAGLAAMADHSLDAAEQHSSLRDTISWSFGLLEPPPQALLARLAVFAGPFDWEVLEAVARAHDDGATGSRSLRLADDLGALVSAGLVRRASATRHSSTDHYLVPAPVRQFAFELLEESGEMAVLRRRHADYYRAVARRAGAARWSFGGQALARRLVDGRRELTAALDQVATEGAVLDALSFAADLEGLWLQTLSSGIGVTQIGGLLEQARGAGWTPEETPDLGARVLLSQVNLGLWSPEPVLGRAATERLTEASSLARRAGRSDLLLAAMSLGAHLLILEGRPEEAIALAGRALAEPSAEDEFWCMLFHRWRAIGANATGDFPRALDDAIVARDLARDSGDEHQLLTSSHVLAGITGAKEDPRAEVPRSGDLLELARVVGDVWAEGNILIGAALRSVASLHGPPAARYIIEALELARRTDTSYLENLSLFALACTAMSTGRLEAGVCLHGSLFAVLPSMRNRLPANALSIYDALVAQAQEELGEREFARQLAAGRLLNWQRALAYAESFAHELAGERASAMSERAPTDRAAEPLPPGYRAIGPADSAAAPTLSRRENEVLRLLASGCSNKQIAATLDLRPKTVMHYTSSLYRKMEVNGRTEAVMAAWRHGLLSGSDEDWASREVLARIPEPT